MKYIGDWVYDDEPTTIRTANGPLVTLPYSVELNDIPMMIVQHHESDYLLKRTIDQFDRLYAEGAERAKIISLAIHPYISGQPHRIKYLEAIYDHVARHDGVLHWNGEQILDWYLAQASAADESRRVTPRPTYRTYGNSNHSVPSLRQFSLKRRNPFGISTSTGIHESVQIKYIFNAFE